MTPTVTYTRQFNWEGSSTDTAAFKWNFNPPAQVDEVEPNRKERRAQRSKMNRVKKRVRRFR